MTPSTDTSGITVLYTKINGSLRKASTESLLLYLSETWKKVVNSGDEVGVVFSTSESIRHY